jgi:hypothetical protein
MRVAAIACIAALLAGCGSDKNEKLPAACTEGPAAVVQALRKAPAPVTLDGTPISHCFNRGASSDDVQIVGTILLTAAQRLADNAAQGAPGAEIQLGYLIGAAQRGAKRNGLAAEMARRLEAESSGHESKPDYKRGLQAGLSSG